MISVLINLKIEVEARRPKDNILNFAKGWNKKAEIL